MKIKKTLFSIEIEFTPKELRFLLDSFPEEFREGDIIYEIREFILRALKE